jgi:hypothetical protein
MAVTNLITPVDPSGTFPTIPAGSNRVVFLTVNVGQSSAINATAPSAVTIGGVTATFVGGDAPSTVQLRATLSTWQLNEAQIALMSGSAISITGQTGAFTRAIAWGVQDATQSVTTRKNNAYIATGGITMSLARVADSWTFLGGYTQTAEDITLANPTRTSRILNVNIGYAADSLRTVNSTTQSKSYVQSAHVLNIEPAPAQAITSINSGAGVKIGSTGNIADTTGFASAPTDVTIGSLTVTVTDYNSGTGDTTFTVPAPTHEAVYPDIDSTQTVTLSNGSESASLAGVPFEPPAGSTAITVASPINDDSRYLGYWMIDIFGVTPVNGDKFYGIDADVTWTADTGGSAVSLPVTTPVVYWDASTGIAYLLDVTVTPYGIVNRGLTAIGLTQVGLTQAGLTAVGL